MWFMNLDKITSHSLESYTVCSFYPMFPMVGLDWIISPLLMNNWMKNLPNVLKLLQNNETCGLRWDGYNKYHSEQKWTKKSSWKNTQKIYEYWIPLCQLTYLECLSQQNGKKNKPCLYFNNLKKSEEKMT